MFISPILSFVISIVSETATTFSVPSIFTLLVATFEFSFSDAPDTLYFVTEYCAVSYSNTTMYFPCFIPCNAYVPSDAVVAVITFPLESFS